MAEFLRNWIINITVIIIFIMLLETIIPSSSMKRYINVIVGLMIIVVVIKPFVLVKDYAEDFHLKFLETSGYIEQSGAAADSERIVEFQQKMAVEVFENNLKRLIERIIDENIDSEYGELSINLWLEKDFESKDFGRIKSVEVIINNNSGEVIEVDKIKIAVNEGAEANKNVINKDKVEYNLNNSRIRSDIRDEISKALGISESIVSVEVRQ
ncbi:MAG: stage III sporulation protein AF [Gracilibacteraceae bacterium]|jgi:stage III sporulation protein AF|nr:stage III sporulation protein AF [Gracilibacteraceae bacterium]